MQTWKIYVVEQTFCLHHLVRNILQTFIYNSRRILWNIFMNDSNYLFSNSIVNRQRLLTLHRVIFSYYFGVNLIIGGVLLTLAILTLQRQPDGQVKFAMEIDKKWHLYQIFIYWFIWRTLYFFQSIALVRWGVGMAYFLVVSSLELRRR